MNIQMYVSKKNFDVQKAERVLGWRAKRDIEDMCRDAWNWQKNCDF